MANWFPWPSRNRPLAWWRDLREQFITNFTAANDQPATKDDLRVVAQRPDKTLRKYVQCFGLYHVILSLQWVTGPERCIY
jgi:hypothetical protein